MHSVYVCPHFCIVSDICSGSLTRVNHRVICTINCLMLLSFFLSPSYLLLKDITAVIAVPLLLHKSIRVYILTDEAKVRKCAVDEPFLLFVCSFFNVPIRFFRELPTHTCTANWMHYCGFLLISHKSRRWFLLCQRKRIQIPPFCLNFLDYGRFKRTGTLLDFGSDFGVSSPKMKLDTFSVHVISTAN